MEAVDQKTVEVHYLQTQSPDIAKLADALCKAQASMKPAAKSAENPFFHSSYADLTSIWEAARGPLTGNGLSVVQTTDGPPEMVTVVTTLMHSSGQWIRGTLRMRPVKGDPQGIGSCLTYARRYALAAIVGVAPEDDDGNLASAQGKPQTRQATPPKQTTPPRQSTQGQVDTISDAQRKRLWAIAKEATVTEDQLKDYLFREWNVESSKDIKKKDYEKICKWTETQGDVPFPEPGDAG